MSLHILSVIPTNPTFWPPPAASETGRAVLEAMLPGAPGRDVLAADEVEQLADALGCSVRIVYTWY